MNPKNSIITIAILFLPIIVFSQSSDKFLISPKPVDGDSIFYKTIEYRPVAIKAGIQSEFYAILSIDSLGEITNISIEPIYRYGLTRRDSMIVPFVREKLKRIKWEPGQYKGKKINSKLKIPFIFKLTVSDNLIRAHHEPSLREINNITFELEPLLFVKRAPIIIE